MLVCLSDASDRDHHAALVRTVVRAPIPGPHSFAYGAENPGAGRLLLLAALHASSHGWLGYVCNAGPAACSVPSPLDITWGGGDGKSRSRAERLT